MSASTLTPELARAVEELDEAFVGRVTVVGQDEAGLIVCVRDVPLSERWVPRTGDLWFALPFHYPDCPIYPYYVTGTIPTGGLVPALQSVTWRGMAVTQVSLRHPAWDPAHDTAVGCALLTSCWLRST